MQVVQWYHSLGARTSQTCLAIRHLVNWAATKHRNIRRGVKEVQKFLNKGEKGIVVLAGDTLPIEVYCHVPVMCEERSIPYAYVPSKSALGAAAGSKRPTCVILIKFNDDYEDAFNDCLEEVQALPLPF
ncbi:H/ACA ribonucleoprotein complex subunit 2 isoform X2 [Dendrobates tinctorius]|uniref:H/ACA ribonucleoprotein complex subunit 2 isoform X2 n=1 Tax=Dendrobates tinctorius TaxID=92724 RepID=UPI003CC96D6A